MKTALIIGAVILLWLMVRRRPVVPVATPAYTGVSAAGVTGLAAAGAFVGGAIKGYTSTPASAPQPPAAAGISGSASAGLGDSPPLSNDDIMSLLDLH